MIILSGNQGQYINVEDINCLSSYLTDGLYKALKKGYVNKIDEWLDLIEAENNEVAQSLKEMANSYKYDKLISLLDRRESYDAI